MVRVLHSGLMTSVQDLGRNGFQEYGIPISGAMDQTSAKQANVILGNSVTEAVLEYALLGPTLAFDTSAIICFTGAPFEASVNHSEQIPMNTPYKINKGDIVSVKNTRKGVFGYLGIQGGWKAETVFESKSMYQGITTQPTVKKDSLLKFEEHTKIHSSNSNDFNNNINIESPIIEVSKGPEFELLSSSQQLKLTSEIFRLSNKCNRMAYQFENLIINELPSMITSLVQPGTVQLTPKGELIILMRDAQTTGGYSRILQLSEKAIDQLSQKTPGSELRFKILN